MTTSKISAGRLGDIRSLVVWAVLVLATVASYLVGAEHVIENAEVVAASVIAVTFVKVRLVAIHFMELAHAPLLLRGVIEAYCFLTPAVLVTLYLAV